MRLVVARHSWHWWCPLRRRKEGPGGPWSPRQSPPGMIKIEEIIKIFLCTYIVLSHLYTCSSELRSRELEVSFEKTAFRQGYIRKRHLAHWLRNSEILYYF